MGQKRVILINISGIGVGQNGASPNTLLDLNSMINCFTPNLNTLGLEKVWNFDKANLRPCVGCFSKVNILNNFNDSLWGQWELCGIVPEVEDVCEFGEILPDYIKAELNALFKTEVLCCQKLRGVTAMEQFGQLSIDIHAPICYLSEDNTINIICHESLYSQNQLNSLVETYLENGCSLGINKITTRVFAGRRMGFYNICPQKLFMVKPKTQNIFQKLKAINIPSFAVGKVDEYFDPKDFADVFVTRTNDLAHKLASRCISQNNKGLIYINLLDSNLVYAIKGDTLGLRKCLEEDDVFIGKIIDGLKEEDLLVVTSDMGVDIINKSNKHKQQVPVLIYNKNLKANFGFDPLESLAEVGEMVYSYLVGEQNDILQKLKAN